MTTATAPVTTAWQIDPTHTDVEFSVRHLMISNVKGRFAAVTGTVALDEGNTAAPAVNVAIDVASIDTRNEQRDTHLRSADFFNAAEFPTLTFTSRSLAGDPSGHFTLVGDLTIRGVTRQVTLGGELEGRGDDPWGNERLGYSASGKIDRRDFGLTWNQALEAGGVAVGHDVKITINTELSRPKS
jgi:polyisoprenoid-binding protein YceI